MATNFPTALDTSTQLPVAATLAAENLSDFPHSTAHGNVNDAIKALEAKVGIDNSAVTTSVDWLLKNLPGITQEATACTTAVLAANTYNNGASGVGATLTGNSNAALAAQDGVTLTAGQTLVVNAEAAPAHNGAYVVTQVGDGSHPYILTRNTWANSPTTLTRGLAVLVDQGTHVGGVVLVLAANVTTVGTSAVNFGASPLGDAAIVGGSVLGVPVIQFSGDTNLSRQAAGVLASTGYSFNGLTGAVSSWRIVGGHAGTPTTGTFVANDVILDTTNNTFQICTVGGTPGTWVKSTDFLPTLASSDSTKVALSTTGGVTTADVSQVANVGNTPFKVRGATQAALSANTYNNGTSGVGATLTANSNVAIGAQDGVTFVQGDIVLVTAEATGANNGVYTVTAVGTGSNPYILTRHPNFDTAGELKTGVRCVVTEGTYGAARVYYLTANCTTVGTTAQVWSVAPESLSAIELWSPGMLSASLEAINVTSGTRTPVVATQYLVRMPMPRPIVIANVHYEITTLASGATHGYLGIYDSSGNLLVQSSDLIAGSVWTSTGAKTTAMVATPPWTNAASYFFISHYQGTGTVAQFRSGGNVLGTVGTTAGTTAPLISKALADTASLTNPVTPTSGWAVVGNVTAFKVT